MKILTLSKSAIRTTTAKNNCCSAVSRAASRAVSRTASRASSRAISQTVTCVAVRAVGLRALSIMLAAILCASFFPISHRAAIAEENSSSSAETKTAYQIQQDIESAQVAYTEARTVADEAAGKVAEQEEKIIDIEENLLPQQQERTSKAAIELYKMQQSSMSLVDILLNADNLRDFITHFDSIAHITAKNLGELERLIAVKNELRSYRSELREVQKEADAKADEAKSALNTAKEAQAEEMRRIEEEARLLAQASSYSANMAEEKRTNDTGSAQTGASSSTSNSSSSANSGNNTSNTSGSSSSSDTSSSSNNTDSSGESGGSSNKDEGIKPPPPENASVDVWAARINAYLAGSPMAGQGMTFASAALSYGIDPRFSPAIACLESGKGNFCFLPYNAWGWGSASWGSWEQAINSHVRGLASIYGFSPTVEGAKMYCPPNWEHWYNFVCSQMALI